jgi:2C-methyl-D-erythritol 2,4-cyclodiphosphate synthase
MEPINYLQQVADPFAQALQGYKLGAGIVDVEAKRAQAEQQQQQLQLAMQEQARFFAKPNPTMRDALQFAAVLPKDRADALRPYIENFSKEQQQNVLKANGQILSALQVNPETGIKMLKDYATAQRNGGDEEEASLYDRLAEAASDPAKGPAMAFKSLVTVTSRIPGAKEMFETIDKATTTAREEALAPVALRRASADADAAVADAKTKQATATNAAEKAAADAAKATADAQKAAVDAQYAERVQLAGLEEKGWNVKNLKSQISDRSARLGLDQQTMQATVAEKLSSIQKNLNEIPADTRKLINESATLAAASKQSANQMNDLAKRIEDLGGYGTASRLGEFAKKTLGAEGYETGLRQEYTRLRNQAGIKSLPPGPATDKDIQLALKGFPEDTSNSKSIASFLRGMAKLQEIDAASNNAKTDWLAQNNGTLTRAGKTFIAGDYTVNTGETFNDFNSRVVTDISKRYRSREQQMEDERAATMAKIPTIGTPAAAPAPVNIRAQADAILNGGR